MKISNTGRSCRAIYLENRNHFKPCHHGNAWGSPNSFLTTIILLNLVNNLFWQVGESVWLSSTWTTTKNGRDVLDVRLANVGKTVTDLSPGSYVWRDQPVGPYMYLVRVNKHISLKLQSTLTFPWKNFMSSMKITSLFIILIYLLLLLNLPFHFSWTTILLRLINIIINIKISLTCFIHFNRKVWLRLHVGLMTNKYGFFLIQVFNKHICRQCTSR